MGVPQNDWAEACVDMIWTVKSEISVRRQRGRMDGRPVRVRRGLGQSIDCRFDNGLKSVKWFKLVKMSA